MTDEQEEFNQEQQRQLRELFRMSDLAVRYKEGVLTKAEELELIQWADESPEHRAWLDAALAEETLSFRMDAFKESASSSQAAFQDLIEKIGGERRRVRRRSAAILCTLLIVCGVGGYLFLHRTGRDHEQTVASVAQNDMPPGGNKATLTLSNGQTVVLDSAHTGVIAQQPGRTTVVNTGSQVSYTAGKDVAKGEALFNTVSTGRGGQYKLVLSDGTKVWLDASSSLHFPTSFRGSKREVELEGQGYFEVGHRKEPFIVHTTRKTDIIDLGTSFNINAYSDEAAVQTTLLKGSVKVEAGGQSRLLVPGQQAYSTEGGSLTVKELDNPEEIAAWKDGQFVFRNTDLRAGMRMIARWYDVGIEYEGNAAAGRGITGSAPLNENLSVLVRLLNATGIHCRMEEKKIVVMP